MVQRINEVCSKYQDRLREMQAIPRLSYGRGLQRRDGAPNRMFLTCLFCHHELAIQFLKDVELIRCKVQCNTCERDMTWSADPNRCDGFRWRCRRSVAGVKCHASTSIRHGSWFQLSNLTLAEIMVCTYDILCRESAHQIGNEYNLVIIRSPTGVCSAGKPCSITWRAALKKSVVLILWCHLYVRVLG